MYSMHSESEQTETSEFGAEKDLLVQEAPTRKMGDVGLSQTHLAGWLGHKILKTKW